MNRAHHRLLAVVSVVWLAVCCATATADRTFATRYSTNANGNILQIGNTNLSCPTSATNCTGARNGTNSLNNDSFVPANVDVDSDTTTFNSSNSTLAIPAGGEVLFAGLYWSGNTTSSARNSVQFGVPGGAYQTITATTLDTDTSTANNGYQGFADVTAQVKAGGSGVYTVANVQTTMFTTAGSQWWAGWSMYVVYRLPTEPMRNLNVFDGWRPVSSTFPTTTVNVSGFLTPPTGPVAARVGLTAYEGDRNITGDSIALAGTVLTNGTNPTNNFMNSSITNLGANVTTRNPTYVNTLGMDIDMLDANGIIPPSATSTSFTFQSGGDLYFPGVLSLAIDIFTPQLQPTFQKTVTDLNGGDVRPGDILEYSVPIDNTGQDTAINVQLNDAIPANTTYVPGSLVIASGANAGTKTDAAGDDQANFSSATNSVTFRLGTGATATAGGSLSPGASCTAVPASCTAIRFRVQVNAGTADGVKIDNQAAVTYSGQLIGPGTVFTADTNVARVTVVNPPVLAATKAAALTTDVNTDGIANPGDTLTYTVRITNTGGGPATGVVFTDTPGTGTTLVGGSVTTSTGTVDSATAPVKVTIPSLAAGQTATITFRVTLDSPFPAGQTQVSNQGAVASTNAGSLQTDDPATTGTAGDATLTPVVTATNVTMTKTVVDDNGGSIVPGDTLTYTVTASNSGNTAATGVTITDTPASPLTLTGTPTASSGTVGTSGNTVTVNGATIAGGNGTLTLTFKVTVPAPLPAGVATAANQASLTGANVTGTVASDDPTTTTPADPTSRPIVAAPRIAVTKDDAVQTDVDGDGNVDPGDTIRYTVTITNTGNQVAGTVTLTDTPGTNTALVVGSVTTSAGSVTTGNAAGATSVAVAVGPVSPGTPVTIRFDVRVATPLPAGVTSVSNQATVSGSNFATVASDDPATTATAGDATVTPVTAAPVIRATKTVVDENGGLLVPGDTVTYTMVITNSGDQAASAVVVSDVIDPNLAVVPGSVTATQGTSSLTGGAGGFGGTLTITGVDTIAGGGATVTVTFSATVRNPFPVGVTAVSNQATVSGANITSVATDDTSVGGTVDPTTRTVTAAPAVTLTKRDEIATDVAPAGASPGDTIRYTLIATNTGTRDASAVQVADAIPANTSLVTGSVTTTSGTVTAGNAAGDTSLAVSAGTVAGGGGTVAVTFLVRINSPVPAGVAQVANQATVSGGNFASAASDDPDTAAAGDATLTAITAAPALVVTKTALDQNGGALRPGDTISYTVTVTNRGTQDASGVSFTDQLDPNLAFGSKTAGPGTVVTSGGTGGFGELLTVNGIGTVAGGGGTATVTFTATVRAPLPAGVAQVANQAVVSATNVTGTVASDDPAVSGSADPTVNAVTAAPSVTATKSVTPTTTLAPGDTVTYTITVTNTGDRDAAAVAISDPIDPNLRFVAKTSGPGTATLIGADTGGFGGTLSLGGIGTVAGGGGTATVVYTATVRTPLPAGVTQVSNQASVSGGNFTALSTDDPATAPAGDATVSPVAGAPAITATKTDARVGTDVAPPGPSPGDTIEYTVVVTNTGNQDATGVSVVDAAPSNTTLVTGSVTTTQAGATVVSGNGSGDTGVTVNLGTIAGGGGTATVTFRVTVANPVPAGVTQIANQGTVTGTNVTAIPTDDPDTATAGDATLTPVTAAPQITYTKDDALLIDADSSGGASPGDTLRYTLVVTNTGTMVASGVAASDTPGANTALVVGSVTTTAGVVTAGNSVGTTSVGVDVGSVTPGTPVTITFDVRIASAVGATVTQVANQGTLTATNVAGTVSSDDPATPATTGDATATPITAAPRVTATKSVADTTPATPVQPGDTLLYTITLSNTGNRDATAPTLTDSIDPNLAVVTGSVTTSAGTASASPGAGGFGGTLSVTGIGTLAAGGTITVTFQATIRSSLPAGVTEVGNQATIAGGNFASLATDDPSTSAPGDATVTSLTGNPQVVVTKTVAEAPPGTAPAAPGDTLRYTILVTNRGTQDATGVVVNDLAPANTTLVNGSVSSSQGSVTSGNVSGSQVTVAVGTLQGGTTPPTVTITFDVTVNSPLPAGVTQVANQATASGGNFATVQSDDPTTATAGDATSIGVTAAPIVASTKTVTDVNGGSVQPGDTLLYTVVMANTGNQAASSVSLSDPVDPNLAVVTPLATSMSGPGTRALTGTTAGGGGGTLAVTAIGDIPGGGSVTITFRATVRTPLPAGVTQVANQATVSGGNFTTVSTDDTSLTDTTPDPTISPLVAAPVMSATKAVVDVNGGSVVPGEVLEYTVTITNSGDRAESSVTLSDTVDANLTLVSGSGTVSQGTVTLSPAAGGGGTVTANLGTVAGAGATATVTFRVIVNTPLPAGASPITNTATVTGTETGTTTSNTTSTSVVAAPVLSATKTLTDGTPATPLVPGDTVTYTVTITNSGDLAATGVSFTDQLDANLDFGAKTAGPGTVVASGGTGGFGELLSFSGIGTIAGGGASANVTFTATIRDPLPAGVTQIANQAVVGAANVAGTTASNDPSTAAAGDATVTPVVAAPDVSATKTASPTGALTPGATVTYTITIANTGNEDVSGLALSDPIDPNLRVLTPLTTTMTGPGTRSLSGTSTGGFGGTLGVSGIDVAGHSSVTITFQATVRTPLPAGATEVANQATVEGGGITPVLTDANAATPAPERTVNPVTAAPVVAAVKTLSDLNGGSVAPGDTVEYTVVLTNTGDRDAAGVSLSDAIDPNLAVIPTSMSSSQGTPGIVDPDAGGFGGTLAVPDIGTVPGGGGSVTVTFRARVRSPFPSTATTITNQATISGSNFTTTASDDTSATDPTPDPTIRAVVGAPALAMTKSALRVLDADSSGTTTPGDRLLYTVILTNSGTTAALGVALNDAIPANTTLVPGSVTTSQGTVTSATGPIGVDLGTIEGGGAIATVTFRVQIVDPLPAGVQSVANAATATGGNITGTVASDDPATTATGDPTVTAVDAAPDIAFTKIDALRTDVDGDGVVDPGDTLSYTLTIVNNGRENAAAFDVNDILDPNLRLIPASATISPAGLTVTTQPPSGTSGGEVHAAIPGLAGGGGTVTITFDATVVSPLPAGVTEIANQATLVGSAGGNVPGQSSDDPATAAGDDPTVTPLTAAPAVEAAKVATLAVDSDGDGVASPGDIMEYTVTITNTGNQAATAVTVSDVVDPNLAPIVTSAQTTSGAVTLTAGAGGFGGSLAATVGTLGGGGGSATITFRATVRSPLPAGVTQVSNQAMVSGGNFPSTTSDDPATAAPADATVTTLSGTPRMTLTKTARLVVDSPPRDGVISPGDTVLYSVTATNTGNAAASGIVISDVPNPNTALVVGSVVTDQGTVVRGNAVGDRDVRVDVGTIPGGGGSVTVSFAVTVDSPLAAGVTQIANQAALTGTAVPAVTSDDPTTATAGDPTVVSVSASPVVGVTKAVTLATDADGDGTPSPGDTLRYTLIVSNTGNQSAANVTMNDLIDANLAIVAGSGATDRGTVTLTAGASGFGGSASAAIGTLPGGTSSTITFRVTVRTPLPAGVTQVTNQATVSGTAIPTASSDDPATAPVGDPTVVNLTAAPSITATKHDTLLNDADGNGVPSPGDTILYTLRVINLGNQAATNVTLFDVVDPNVTLVAGSGVASSGTVTLTPTAGGGGNVSADLGTIAGGGTNFTVTFEVRINAPLPAGVTQIANQATVSANGLPSVSTDDPETGAPGDRTITPVTAAPVMTATKADTLATDADGNGVPSPGDILLYTIRVTNSGNAAASSVTIADIVDGNLALVADSGATGSGTVTLSPGTGGRGGSVAATIGTIPGGETVTVTYRATVVDPLPVGVTSVSNQASVSAGNAPTLTTDDPSTAAPGDATVTTLTAAPVVSATKTDAVVIDADGDGSASPGDTLLYTVRVANTGNQAAAGIAVTDVIDANLTFVAGSGASDLGSVTLTPGTGGAGGTMIADIGTLPGGTTVAVTFRVTLANPLPAGVTQIDNQATVRGTAIPTLTTDDPDTTAVGDATTTPVTASARIAVAKRDTLVVDADGNGVPSPGDTLLYTVAVQNTGNQAATGVSVRDTPGAGSALVAGTVAAATGTVVTGNGGADTAVRVDVGTLPGGMTTTVTFRVSVADPLPAGMTQVANQAIVTATGLPDAPSDDPDTAAAGDRTVTPLTAAPLLTATKRAALVTDADGNGVASPGDTLAYTVVVTNSGNQAATGVSVSDVVSPNLVLVAGSGATDRGTIGLTAGAGETGGSVSVDVGTLPGGGATATASFRATIVNPLPAGVTEVANQASVASPGVPTVTSDDPDTAASGDATVVALTAAPRIAATKAASVVNDVGATGPSPGDTLLYRVAVRNTGNQAASGVTFSDLIGANQTLVPASVASDHGTITAGNVAGDTRVGVDVGTLPGGEVAVITFRVTIANPLPAGVSQVANQGVVGASGLPDTLTDDTSTADAGDATVTPVDAFPRLRVTKSDVLTTDADANGVPSPGDRLTYTLTITNTGNQADTNVSLSDTVSSTLQVDAGSIVASDGTATLTPGTAGFGGTLTWNGITTLPGGGTSATLTVTATIRNPLPAGVTQINNQAVTRGDAVGPTPSDDPTTPTAGDATVTPVTAAPALAATKTAQLVVDADGNGVPSPGDTLLYTVRVTNDGNQTAAGVTISDIVDPNLAMDAATVAISAGTASGSAGPGGFGGSITGTVAALPGGGATVTLTFRATVRTPLPAGVVRVSNQAAVAATGTASVLSDDPATTTVGDPTVTSLTVNPVVTATKRDSLVTDADGDGSPSPGDTIRYTIVVVNSGNSEATAVQLADLVDANLALVAGSGTITPGTGRSVTLNTGGSESVAAVIGSLPGGGGSATVTFSARIDDPLPAGVVQVANQAVVSGGNIAPVATDDPDTQQSPDRTVTQVVAAPRMSATKVATLFTDADGNGSTSPGDTLLYSITVRNDGNMSGLGVLTNDVLDPSITLLPGTVVASQGSVIRGNAATDAQLEVDLGDIAGGGGVATITFRLRVKNPLPAGVTGVANQATITGANFPPLLTDDPATAQVSDPTATAVVAGPRVNATKRVTLVADPDNSAFPSPGDTLLYTITIINQGNQAATGVSLSDVIDPNLAVVAGSVTTSAGTASVTGQAVDGFGGTLAVSAVGTIPGGNGSVTVTYRATVRSPIGSGVQRVVNQAIVSGTNFADTPTDDPTTGAPDDPTAPFLLALPDMQMTKRAALVIDRNGDGRPSPGDRLQYLITVVNAGNREATGMVVSDTLDPNVTLIGPSVQVSQGTITAGADGGSTVTVDLGALAGGKSSATIAYSVEVNSPLLPSVTTITNAARLAGDNFTTITSDDPATTPIGDATVVQLVAAPRVSVTKTARLTGDANADGVAEPGETLTFDLAIENTGPYHALAVVLTDTLDSGFALIPGSLQTSQGTVTAGGAGGPDIAVDLGTIAGAGGRATVSFQVRIANPLPVGTTALANQASVSGTNVPATASDDPTTPAAGDATRVGVVAGPAVTFTKRAALGIDANGDGAAGSGDTVEYTLVARNAGTMAAAGVRITDTPDAATSLVAGSVTTDHGTVGAGNAAGERSVAVDVGDLAAGATATIRFRVVIGATATDAVRNQAVLTGANVAQLASDDPTTATPGDATVLALDLAPRLTVVKAATPVVDADRDRRVGPGDLLQYTITVTNAGGGPARDVVVTDPLPPQVAPLPGSLTATKGTVSLDAGRTVRADVGTLGPRERVAVSVVVRILPVSRTAMTIRNQATVRAAGIETVLSDSDRPGGGPADPTVTRAVAPVRMRIAKTGPRAAVAGQIVTYRIRVTNADRRVANGVLILDPLPTGMSLVGVSTPGRLVRGTVQWRVPRLRPGQTLTLTLRVRLTGTSAGGRVNVARIAGANFPPSRALAGVQVRPGRIGQPSVTG